MGEIGSELFIIVLLTLANGFFAGSEIAIVSARRSRLEQQAALGHHGAQQALELADNPDRFLATVQVGISLIGTFAAAFGGARIGDILTAQMGAIPALAPYAEPIALAIVVLGLTYLSLVLGELAPKRLALQHAERMAVISAPIMTWIARLARPLVGVLTFSVMLLLRLVGQGRAAQQEVTEEDITFMIREATTSGTVEAGEAQLIKRVFQFTDRPVVHVMTPRTEITAVAVDMPWPEILQALVESAYSRVPVYQSSLDHVVGILHAKDCLPLIGTPDTTPDILKLMRPPTFLLASQHIDDVLTMFRRQGSHLGLVIDEYGQVAGLVTLEDILEELVGEIHDEYDQAEEPPFIQRADGSWLVDGMESYEKVCERVGLPPVAQHDFTTLAGFIIAQLGHVPTLGESVVVDRYTLEIIDMDGHRIDKVLIQPKQRLAEADSEADGESGVE